MLHDFLINVVFHCFFVCSYKPTKNIKKGDVEKGLGWKPIPLFDRDHAEEVASMQVYVEEMIFSLFFKLIFNIK